MIEEKSEETLFIEDMREKFKDLHFILNSTISFLYRPMEEVSFEYKKGYVVEQLEELLIETKKIQKEMLGSEE